MILTSKHWIARTPVNLLLCTGLTYELCNLFLFSKCELNSIADRINTFNQWKTTWTAWSTLHRAITRRPNNRRSNHQHAKIAQLLRSVKNRESFNHGPQCFCHRFMFDIILGMMEMQLYSKWYSGWGTTSYSSTSCSSTPSRGTWPKTIGRKLKKTSLKNLTSAST